jgi:hypothetical protein
MSAAGRARIAEAPETAVGRLEEGDRQAKTDRQAQAGIIGGGTRGNGKLVAIGNETDARRSGLARTRIGSIWRWAEWSDSGIFESRPSLASRSACEIIGTVGDVRSSALDLPLQPEVFYNDHPYPWYGPTMLVGTGKDPQPLAAAIRREATTLNYARW